MSTLAEKQKFDAIVYPVIAPLKGRLLAQPSKNYTTRYLLAAALASGISTVSNCAASADSHALQACLTMLGARLTIQADNHGALDIRMDGFGSHPSLAEGEAINPGNAGAVLRMLLGIGALLPEARFTTHHTESLGKRPNNDLLDALAQLGCQVESDEGCLPITLRGGNLHGGAITVSGSKSSQFLSSLLFLTPLISEPVEITVTGDLVSKAPVRQTLEVLRSAGLTIEAREDLQHFRVNPGEYRPRQYRVNGDWPGSSALLAAVAIAGGELFLEDLKMDEQGEKAALQVLTNMGATHQVTVEGIAFQSAGQLCAVEFDGDLATDAVLALIGAACFAKGRTRFYNVSNLRIKECDRISEPIAELRKLGVQCWEGNEVGDPDPDAIIIEGNPDGYEGGITVDGRDDHRVIMLLATVALRCRKPVTILRSHEVSKSYPRFFDHLQQIGGQVKFEVQ